MKSLSEKQKKGKEMFEWIKSEYFNPSVSYQDHVDRAFSHNEDAKARVPKGDKLKIREKGKTVSVWLSQDLDIKPKDFFTVLETLEHGGNIGIQRFRELIKHESLKTLFDQHGFPVKLNIPLIYSI